MARFADEIAGLGAGLGAVLVQLPPSLAFLPSVSIPFLETASELFPCPIVCEPRHPSWFAGRVDAVLSGLAISRVGADPAVAPGAGEAGGNPDLVYLRMHGSPRTYFSNYDEEAISLLAAHAAACRARGATFWCVFDNTAAGHATGNALALLRTVSSSA